MSSNSSSHCCGVRSSLNWLISFAPELRVQVTEVTLLHVAFVVVDIAPTLPTRLPCGGEERFYRPLIDQIGSLLASLVHVASLSWIRLTIVFRVLQYSGVS